MTDHIINKEIFEFSYSETEWAFAMQKQMNSGLQYELQSVINSNLDQWNHLNGTIRLNKLEIDLGQIPFERLSDILPGRLETEFRYKLAAAINERKIYTENLQWNDPKDDSKHPDEHEGLETLEIFLLSGSLPWWAERGKVFSVDETISFLAKKDPGQLRTFLFKYISNKQFVSRLLYQAGNETFTKLLELLGISLSQITSIKNVLEKFFSQPLTDIQKIIFRLLSEALSIYDISESADQFLLKCFEKLGERIVSLPYINVEDGYSMSMLAKEIFYATKSLSIDRSATSSTYDHSTISDIKTGDEKIYLQNAGLVLIAPFLPSLFKELQWVTEGRFVNKELQHKAIFLLHYLTTGETAAPEYTLQLNKIFCSVNPDEPIPFSVDLNEKEKQEADLLLSDIITHWEVLKNSSKEALQGSFLLRDGLLSFTNNHWLIQIERKGYDILLDQIPWSWKMIQFGWMDFYIETEW